MADFDARVTPARADVAAAHLKGAVEAARFVEGRVLAVGVGIAALRSAASETARLETQLFFGEGFTVYDAKDGWAWGQCAFDSYVGYVHERDLVPAGPAATHRITAPFSHVYAADDVKAAALRRLPMNAKVAIAAAGDRFAALAGGGFVPAPHIAPLDHQGGDFVAHAERLLRAPYLWGGRSADGIDCSGLVQAALECTGVAAPRDSDMQERELGVAVEGGVGARLQRGDLVFWADHVGIMTNAAALLHANSHHMAVAKEPLALVIARAEAKGSRVTLVRRLGFQ
jgi:cell wall-associated NlpC family hydrolase